MMAGNFESCKHQPTEEVTTKICKNETVCSREFVITYINIMPYYKMKHLVETMFTFCCGTCARLRTFQTLNDTSKITTRALSSSDVVYPFLGPTTSQTLYGFNFVPMIQAPRAYYITLTKNSPRAVLMELVESCTELWPLIVMAVLLSAVSGCSIWFLDTWSNETHFPRPFFQGAGEGFWWAFVSMTTVGYGGRAPKSVAARVVAVLWILTGIAVCSSFTASLTAGVTEALVSETPSMEGRKVGWLKSHLYEGALIAENHGHLVPVQGDDYITNIKRLFEKLSTGEVDGILLDVYVYNDFRTHLHSLSTNDNATRTIKDLVFNRTIPTAIPMKKTSVSYGMLIRDSMDSAYFRKYVSDNVIYMQTCNKLQLNDVKLKIELEPVGIFSVEAGMFLPTLKAMLALLGVISMFGILFEFMRRKIEEYQ